MTEQQHIKGHKLDDEELDEKLGSQIVTNTQVRNYLKRRTGIVLAETTMRKRACVLQNFAEHLEQQGTTVIDAEREHIVNYIEACVLRGNRRETVRNKRSAVKELYKYLQVHSDRADEIDVDPLDIDEIRLDEFIYKPDNETIDRGPLSQEETIQLYEAMDNYRNRLMVTVGAETGLRNSDIRELKLDDIDLDEQEITARDSKTVRPIQCRSLTHSLWSCGTGSKSGVTAGQGQKRATISSPRRRVRISARMRG